MEIKTVNYVTASDLFKDAPKVKSLFVDYEPDFVWGVNAHSLTSVLAMERSLNEIYDELHEDDLLTCEQEKQFKIVFHRLEGIATENNSKDIFVDLEN